MSNNNNNLNHHNKLINHHHHHHILPPTTTTNRSNSTTQACAACRYQRRKCAPDCILAPYFPHDRQRQFQNAHKLFGVSNITKIIRDLDTPQKDEAMRTIIYQADVRAHDPVGGCYRIIRELQRQIEYSRAELDIVLHQLAFCRTHAQNQNHQLLFDCDVHLDDDNNNNNPDDVDLYDHGLDLDLGQQQDEQYMLGEHHLNDQEDGHVAPIQETNSWANMNNSPPSSAVCLEVRECDAFKPLMIPAGERHEFKFEFDDINEPSEETLDNDGNQKTLTKEDNVTFFTKDENVSYQQHNEDNDLKGAATLFTLTNCSSY
ncbi:putative transcription factor AS2-LOB family [Helianthus annuus]|uniref:Putative LOB domain-containing protein n=1 Tax=Helianthus annuus TaxID=4232 RepID=A0A251VQB1_HELAN|nr:LOB domain-containing protein 22 [Helianthus annuus]KAF5816876.1 putative transcription factor AS2-LOB family [Helianthus annuus]KAJ0617342.1 putative transcription factor AS2-LOB family [Helianthus annuus]KAJ0950253.1 putative transcription factor AS2-LOB family [Helianthus annuus]